ncbi:MAG TPA: hypothetical protein VGL93_11030 [Streptosporangiaceae bacterium]|jgi:hypothetical protein
MQDYAARHRGSDHSQGPDTLRTKTDRPGQPSQADINRMDERIAAYHRRHPNTASERAAIWAKMRESDAFAGTPPSADQDVRRSGTTDQSSDSLPTGRPRDDDRAEPEGADRAADDPAERTHDRQPSEQADLSADPLDAPAPDRPPEVVPDPPTEPEIIGMRLPDGFDNQGDVPWLHRHDDDRPIQPPGSPDGGDRRPQEPRPATPDWLPPDDAPPVDVQDQEEVAEKHLDAISEPSSKLRKLSAEFVRDGDEMVDLANKVASKAGGLFGPPPDQAHAEVRAPQPVWQAPQHASIDFGELGGAGIALGVIMFQVARKIRGHDKD